MCLCVSGSVAAVKAPDIVERLLERSISVDLVVTQSAERLLHASYRGSVPWARLVDLAKAYAQPGTVPVGSKRTRSVANTDSANGGNIGDAEPDESAHALPRLQLWRDEDEWNGYNAVGADEVLHVELAKRNQLLLVAPLCANTLAAMALGSCSNLLTSVVRAWYYDLEPEFATPLARRFGTHTVARPIVVAPAMNTFMWYQRVTGEHMKTLEARGISVVPPVPKTLACGDKGVGAMADVDDVVEVAAGLLEQQRAADEQSAASGLPAFSV